MLFVFDHTILPEVYVKLEGMHSDRTIFSGTLTTAQVVIVIMYRTEVYYTSPWRTT